MKNLLETLAVIIAFIFLIVPWLAGFVFAKGFWSTLFCIIPFYSWYLVVEHFIIKYAV